MKMKRSPKSKSRSMSQQGSRGLNVRPASQLAKHRSCVLYGRSGTGKTTVAGTFPTPALLLDCKDEGTDSVSDVEGLDVLDVKTWDEFEDAYWWLHAHPGKYKTVIIDTLSQVQQIAIEQITKCDDAGNWGTMTKGDWGNVASLLKSWIINIRDLPCNVVFIAQDRIFNADDEGESGTLDPEVGPQVMPSVAKHLNAAVNIIGNTFIRRRVSVKKIKIGKKTRVRETEHIEYCLRVGPNPVYVTKVRKPKSVLLPSVIVDPTYNDLMNIVKGNK